MINAWGNGYLCYYDHCKLWSQCDHHTLYAFIKLPLFMFTPIKVCSYYVSIVTKFFKKQLKGWQGCKATAILDHWWWDCKLIQPFYESVY